MKKMIAMLFVAFTYIFAATEAKTDMFGRALPDEQKIQALEAIAKKAEKGEKINEKELRDLTNYFQNYHKEVTNKRIEDKEIIHFYKGIVEPSFPNAKVKLVSREYLGKTQYEKVVVEIEMNGDSIKDVVFVYNQYLLPDIIDIPTAKSLKEDEKKEIQRVKRSVFEEKALEAFKSEKKIISLGNLGKRGKEIYVFSDPECPYCRKHLEEVNEKFLENNRIHFIFVSVHGKSAFEKIALLWKELPKAKSDSDKLKIIRKYYADDVQYTAPDEKSVKEAEILFSKYMVMGLRQVPYIIEIEPKDTK